MSLATYVSPVCAIAGANYNTVVYLDKCNEEHQKVCIYKFLINSGAGLIVGAGVGLISPILIGGGLASLPVYLLKK